MDDSEIAVVFPHREINGNFALPGQVYSSVGEDEVDSSRVMLPPGLDETDSSPSSALTCPAGLPKNRGTGKTGNDNEDDGYCSQDQMHTARMVSTTFERLANAKRHTESTFNNNLSPPLYPSSSEDATGKVIGVSMPPNYVVRSNERRTTFRPNGNGSSSILDNTESACTVQLAEIPSRNSLEHNRSNVNAHLSRRTAPSDKTLEYELKDNHAHNHCANINRNDNQHSLVGLRRSLDHGTTQSCDEAGALPPSRKRKNRDDDDDDGGPDMISPTLAEPDTKRMRGANLIPSQQVQAPPARYQPGGPGNSYDIQGQANWVVQAPKDCTFHIYQTQGSSGGHVKQHPVEWAGVNIQQVTDDGLKAVFEASAKAISQATSWKRFARMLPVSRSPSLEQELRTLDSCRGTPLEKARAVLLRWWREECSCGYDDNIKAKLKEGLEDCGLKRMARDLDRICKKSGGSQ